MPRRALSPGMHAGLSVIMDVQEREYYCSATESVGFKVGRGLRGQVLCDMAMRVAPHC